MSGARSWSGMMTWTFLKDASFPSRSVRRRSEQVPGARRRGEPAYRPGRRTAAAATTRPARAYRDAGHGVGRRGARVSAELDEVRREVANAHGLSAGNRSFVEGETLDQIETSAMALARLVNASGQGPELAPQRVRLSIFPEATAEKRRRSKSSPACSPGARIGRAMTSAALRRAPRSRSMVARDGTFRLLRRPASSYLRSMVDGWPRLSEIGAPIKASTSES